MKNRNGVRLFCRIFFLLRRQKGRYLLGTLLLMTDFALNFYTPYLVKQMLANVTGESNGSLLWILVKLILSTIVIVPLVTIGKYMQAIAVKNGTRSFKTELFGHILSLPVWCIRKRPVGIYVQRLSDDVNRSVGAFGTYAITCLLRFLFVFPIAFIWLLSNDINAALFSLFYSLLSLVLSVYLNPRIKKTERDAKKQVDLSSAMLVESISNLLMIKVFQLDVFLLEKYKQSCDIVRAKRRRFRTFNGIGYAIIDFLTYSAQPASFLIGLVLAKGNPVSQAVFNAYLTSLMAEGMLYLGTFLMLIQPNLISMKNVCEILDESPEDNAIEIYPEGKEGDETVLMSFDHVTFSYPGEQEVILKDLCLNIIEGEHLAIIGDSGSGKTTVLKLILGLYRPSAGRIYVRGIRDERQGLTEVRSMISYIPQDTILFDETILENIRAVEEESSIDEINQAAYMADFNQQIEKFPAKFETPVGENGYQLSGGQRQKVSLIRSIIRDGVVFLMDEPTSALDVESEKHIFQRMQNYLEKKTVVMVTHRLETTKDFDRIIVLRKGTIIKEGTYQELVMSDGKMIVDR